jgi:hypothetical protein
MNVEQDMDWLFGNAGGGPAKQVESVPESYESIEAALTAILNAGPIGRSEARGLVNWDAVEQLFSAELETLALSDEMFSNVYMALKAYGFSANTTRSQIVQYGNSRWSEYSSAVRRLALGSFAAKNFLMFSTAFREIIGDFPALASDEVIADEVIDFIKYNRTDLEVTLLQLRALSGNERQLRRVLRAIGAAGHQSAPHQFSLLCAEWAAASTFGNLQYALWYAPSKKQCDEPPIHLEISGQMRKVADLLVEFGIGVNADLNHYALSNLGAAAMNSWRKELVAVISGDRELEEATIETLLVMGSIGRDEQLLLTIIELAKYADESVAAHIDPDTTLANRRGRACISMLRGAPDVMDLMVEAQRGNAVPLADTTVSQPRTWLGDARVELLFELSVNELAKRVGGEILDNLHAGEETHLAELFIQLKYCLEQLSDRLVSAAKELDSRERFDFSLSQRIIGKPEEGGQGVEHPRFSTDICLIFKAMDEGICLSQRATLIQAKRLQVSTKKSYAYFLKRDQLNDIAQQTLASFLLLLGPAYASTCLPVMPVRLMVDLMKQNASMSLSMPRAATLGKSLGTWLLEDIIGLWTGDDSQKLVDKALGMGNGRPRLIYELVVRRHLKGTDGW